MNIKYMTSAIILILGIDMALGQSALGQARLGLFVTQEELVSWKERAKKGPYKSQGDVSSNSPGDWDRIVQNAKAFLANPAAEHVKGQPAGKCFSGNDDGEPGNSPNDPGSVSTAG